MQESDESIDIRIDYWAGFEHRAHYSAKRIAL